MDVGDVKGLLYSLKGNWLKKYVLKEEIPTGDTYKGSYLQQRCEYTQKARNSATFAAMYSSCQAAYCKDGSNYGHSFLWLPGEKL